MATEYSTAQTTDNSIETVVTQITSRMDQIVQHEAITSGMSASPDILAAFGRSKTAKLPTLTTSGLGDYDKLKGYPVGRATVTYEEYELAYDRGIKIDIDRKERIQADNVATTASVAAELTRYRIIPEIDCTRISRIVSKTKGWDADHVDSGDSPTTANLLSKIGEGLDLIFEERAIDSGATIYLNSKLKPILRNSTEFTKVRNITATPSVDFMTQSIEGNNIVWVPSARMKTAYDYNNPGTGSDEIGGVTASSDAQDIYFLIVAPGCAQGVTVFSVPKYVTAEVNQLKDADSLYYRIYHDVVVEKNQGTSGIYAYTGSSSAASSE